MERKYARLLGEFFDGVKDYKAFNLLDIEKNRYKVKNGKNGISIELEGVYKLNPFQDDKFDIYSKDENLYTRIYPEIEECFLAKVSEFDFPCYEGKVLIANSFITLEELLEKLGNKNYLIISNPLFYSNNQEKNIPILSDFNIFDD